MPVSHQCSKEASTPRYKFVLLDGLEVFLDVCVMSWDSSKLKMAGVRHIYKPPSQESRY